MLSFFFFLSSDIILRTSPWYTRYIIVGFEHVRVRLREHATKNPPKNVSFNNTPGVGGRDANYTHTHTPGVVRMDGRPSARNGEKIKKKL